MPTFEIKSCKKCAFCKYWFDPTLSAIKPENPKINLWSYDSKQKRICTKKNFEMNADATCGMYESKLREYFN